MALEIEYADVHTSQPESIADIDPADMINGDGGSSDESCVLDDSSNEQIEDVSQDGEQDSASQPQSTDPPESPELTDAELQQQRQLAEEHHAIEVSAAKEEHFSLAVKRSELENELKDIKADEKAALRNLRNLIKRGPSYPQPKSKIDEAVAAGGERSAIQVDDPAADTTWRLIPTSTIIDGIKGMGGKKAEAIISLAPTLGDLEELRAKAGLVHKPFGSVLPRGIGGGMADEIENRIEETMIKHFSQVGERVKPIAKTVETASVVE